MRSSPPGPRSSRWICLWGRGGPQSQGWPITGLLGSKSVMDMAASLTYMDGERSSEMDTPEFTEEQEEQALVVLLSERGITPGMEVRSMGLPIEALFDA